MLCKLMPLGHFDHNTTEKLLRHYGLEESAELVYHLTVGHPASITYIITQHLLAESAAAGRAAALADQRVDDIRQLIGRLSEPARTLIGLVGVLRRVDVLTIQHVLGQLPTLLPEPVRNQVLHQALAQYVQTGLVVNLPDYAPFSFTPEVRAVIEADLKETRPELFQELCAVLSAWYRRELERKPFTNRLYFTEWIYFSLHSLLLVLAAPSDPAAREQVSQEWLRQFQAHWERVGDDDMSGRLQRDHQIRQLLGAVGLERDVGITADYTTREFHFYRRALVNYLFQHRFPRRLTRREREILVLIARQFDDQGFDLHTLQQVIAESGAEALTIAKLHLFIRQFSEIYAISYDQLKGRFVMDPWLREFLRAPDAGPPARSP
jgi:hypothetical protein